MYVPMMDTRQKVHVLKAENARTPYTGSPAKEEKVCGIVDK
jgi:hypothetical protein